MTYTLGEWFTDHVAIDKGYFKRDVQAKLEQVAAIVRAVEAAPIDTLPDDLQAMVRVSTGKN